MARVIYNNAMSQLVDFPPDLMKLIKYELSYKVGEEGERHTIGSQGMKSWYWDGYKTLVSRNGEFPSGLVPRLNRLLNKFQFYATIEDHRERPMEGVPLWAWPEKFLLRDYQQEAVVKALEMGRGVVSSPPRCISGDTPVQVNRAGKTFWISIRELVGCFNGTTVRSGKSWDLSIPTRIRARDHEGYVRLFDITEAWASGDKDLIEVTLENGRSIKASADHRVLTSDGWREIRQLRVGGNLIAELPRVGGSRQRKCTYRFRVNLFAHPYAGRRGRKSVKGSYCVQTHRLVYESHLNGMGLEAFLTRIRLGDVEGLVFLDPKEVAIHHIDGDPKNNDISNLEAIPHRDHWRDHGLEGAWKHVNYRTGPMRIVSIENAGRGDTYDLTVPGAENFLADTIVTHNSGKTVIMAKLIQEVSSKTVVTAPTKAIAEQTIERFREIFVDDWAASVDTHDDFFLVCDGSHRKNKAAFDRATVYVCVDKSAANLPQEWWDQILCLIVDERHHQASKTYHIINKLARNAWWRWGFTGTNFRSNDDEERVALEACLGNTIVHYSVQEMMRRKILTPARVEFWPVEQMGLRTADFQRAYSKGIVDSQPRNALIVKAANKLLQEGRKVLILVQQIKHGRSLQKMIEGSCFVKGEDGAAVGRAVKALDSGEIQVLIGSPVVGEGLDCPAADALIYAKGRKAKVTVSQDVFRVLTGKEGKVFARIIDFTDRHNKYLLRHSVERMRAYNEMGFDIEILKREDLTF